MSKRSIKKFSQDENHIFSSSRMLLAVVSAALLLALIVTNIPQLAQRFSNFIPATTFPDFCANATTRASPIPIAMPPLQPVDSSNSGVLASSEMIGLSDGSYVFDTQRANQNEVNSKIKAAQYTRNRDANGALATWNDVVTKDSTDAEAQIYYQNQEIFNTGNPYISIIVGVTFDGEYVGGSHDNLQGAFIAQKQCNEKASLNNGLKIVLLIANLGKALNSNNAHTLADMIARQSLQDKTIVGIVGWPLSSATIDITRELRQKNSDLPLISPSSSSNLLSSVPDFFRVVPPDREQGALAGQFVIDQHKKNVAIIYDPTDGYSESLKDAFSSSVSMAGIQIRDTQPYATSDVQSINVAFNSVLAQNKDLDTIFFAGYPGDFSLGLSIVRAKTRIEMIGGDALSTLNEYAPMAASNFSNVYFTSFASQEEWATIVPSERPTFFQNYQETFGEPVTPIGVKTLDEDTILSYDAMQVVLYGCLQAQAHGKDLTPLNVIEAMKSITVNNPIQGVSGRIAFSGNSDPVHKSIVIEHVANGKLVIDRPPDCFSVNNLDAECNVAP